MRFSTQAAHFILLAEADECAERSMDEFFLGFDAGQLERLL